MFGLLADAHVLRQVSATLHACAMSLHFALVNKERLFWSGLCQCLA